jgi:hypothetical protein
MPPLRIELLKLLESFPPLEDSIDIQLLDTSDWDEAGLGLLFSELPETSADLERMISDWDVDEATAELELLVPDWDDEVMAA